VIRLDLGLATKLTISRVLLIPPIVGLLLSTAPRQQAAAAGLFGLAV